MRTGTEWQDPSSALSDLGIIWSCSNVGSGVTPEQLEQIRPRLTRFAATMLGKLNGYDQPAKGELYTRGLLTNGHRTSMQPMAERLGVDHQRLQRFITDSSWDYRPVRTNLARWATATINPDAWVIDDGCSSC